MRGYKKFVIESIVNTQEALDLIFENKPDNLSVMSELYSEAINNLEKEGLIISDPNHSGKSIIRFVTKEMNKVFPRLSVTIAQSSEIIKRALLEMLDKEMPQNHQVKQISFYWQN